MDIDHICGDSDSVSMGKISKFLIKKNFPGGYER
jgi:hypothetical protein